MTRGRYALRSLDAGTRLGPYEILGPLGKGGMGEVYRATDTRLNRDVAVKVLPEEFLEGEERKARFEREARILASLNHPGIAAIYSFEEISSSSSSSSSRHILVMELVEGESLAERLAKGPLPLELVLRHGAEIARALDAAHRKGIVHRDLKPANVMLTKTGVKLLDFGLARAIAPEPTEDALSGLTDAGPLADGRGLGRRNLAVHGARAARRQERRCADGHLRVRRDDVRNGDRPAGPFPQRTRPA